MLRPHHLTPCVFEARMSDFFLNKLVPLRVDNIPSSKYTLSSWFLSAYPWFFSPQKSHKNPILKLSVEKLLSRIATDQRSVTCRPTTDRHLLKLEFQVLFQAELFALFKINISLTFPCTTWASSSPKFILQPCQH